MREDKYSLHFLQAYKQSNLSPCTRVLQGKPVVAHLLKRANHWTHYNIYLNTRWGFFPYMWHLNMWGYLKFAYEVLNQTMPNWIAVSQTMQNQTKACITSHLV